MPQSKPNPWLWSMMYMMTLLTMMTVNYSFNNEKKMKAKENNKQKMNKWW